MVYVTGDTHRQFQRIEEFCADYETTTDDVMVILGDAGINYFGDFRDDFVKKRLSELPISLLCIHGNHEMRPGNIASYQISMFREGFVYFEPAYPNIYFAMDGQVYDLGGKNCLVIGGAYSVDRPYRIAHGLRWFEDEQPDLHTKQMVEAVVDYQPRGGVDIVLSHTCPLKYIPTEVFIPGIDQSEVDNSTEEWLDSIEERMDYERWFCGHYHTDKVIDNVRFLYEDIIPIWPVQVFPIRQDL